MGIFFRSQNQRGDTIIEVLIAIAVASFAIGTSYALANKSLQNAITAGDRNHAINIAQNQIADLKLRHASYSSEAAFNQDFGVPSSASTAPPYPAHGRDFCLLDGPALKSLPNWAAKDNTAIGSAANPETAADDFNNYDQADCLRDGQYYVNVTAMVTSVSKDSANNTVFRIAVRWPTVGGGANSQAVLYYRENSGISSAPSCTASRSDVALVMDSSVSMNLPFTGDPTGRTKMEVTKDAAKQLVSDANISPTGNQMGLITFDAVATSKIWQNLTTDTSALDSSIDQITNHFGTYYLSGLNRTDQVFAGASPGVPRIIIFISDGQPDDVISDIYAKTDALKNSGDVIYTIGVDTASILNEPAEQILTNMASPGQYTSVSDAAGFASVIQNLVGTVDCTPDNILPPPPPPPPACSPTGTVLSFSEDDNLQLFLLNSDPANTSAGLSFPGGHRVESYNVKKYDPNGNSLTLNPGCTYTVTVTTQDPAHGQPLLPVQYNEEMFLEFCADISSSCTTGQNYNSVSAKPIIRTGLTPDLPDAQKSLSPPYQFTFNVASTTSVNYILLKHCSLWQSSFGGSGPDAAPGYSAPYYSCRAKQNQIDGYEISITAS